MKKYYLYLIACLLILVTGCEKEVTIEIPDSEQKIVVEGKIDQGEFPMIILTRSIPYYTVLNEQTLQDMFINDAEVKIHFGNDTIPLIKFCVSDVPDSLKGEVIRLLNLPAGFDKFCVYTSLDPRTIGKSGMEYELLVNQNGNLLNSKCFLPNPIPLDSLWFKPNGGNDSLGVLYANLTDPTETGNSYRIYCQRINKYTSGPNIGQQKDLDFLSPFGAVFDDEFFNGLTFPLAFGRGAEIGSEKPDDEFPERGLYRKGDTVVVKFTTMDHRVYDYYRTLYNSIGSSGSPFAAPANVKSNINNGLGVWAGYGVSLDTIVIP